MTESIGKAYKPWLIASLVVLIVSLGLLAMTMTIAFVGHNSATPLWVIVLSVLGGLGLGLGFAGFFLIMMVAGWSSFREARRVQVIPPVHPKT